MNCAPTEFSCNPATPKCRSCAKGAATQNTGLTNHILRCAQNITTTPHKICSTPCERRSSARLISLKTKTNRAINCAPTEFSCNPATPKCRSCAKGDATLITGLAGHNLLYAQNIPTTSHKIRTAQHRASADFLRD